MAGLYPAVGAPARPGPASRPADSRFPTIPGMDVLTGAQMREADRRTIEDIGIPERVLMENAGRAVAEVVAEEARAADGRRTLLLCGPGGNGGDGLVALRCLAAQGLRATAVLLAAPERLRGAARDNLETAIRLALDVLPVRDEEAWEEILGDTSANGIAGAGPGVLVDAILGTGSSGPLRGLTARVVADLDRLPLFCGARRVAVDIPSGLAADSGRVPELFFRADRTVALAAPKICHFVSPASAACGRVRVAEIGIPRVLLSAGADGLWTNDSARVARLLPGRAAGVHKGQLGRLLLVAGSRRMPGAAALAARGALSAGVGLLTVAGPAEGLGSLPPEAMRLPLPAGDEGEIRGGERRSGRRTRRHRPGGRHRPRAGSRGVGGSPGGGAPHRPDHDGAARSRRRRPQRLGGAGR